HRDVRAQLRAAERPERRALRGRNPKRLHDALLAARPWRRLVRARRRGRGVALRDRRRDSLAARARIERVVPLDLDRLLRELWVLDHVAEPDRIVAGTQVVLPSAVVYTLRDLEE